MVELRAHLKARSIKLYTGKLFLVLMHLAFWDDFCAPTPEVRALGATKILSKLAILCKFECSQIP